MRRLVLLGVLALLAFASTAAASAPAGGLVVVESAADAERAAVPSSAAANAPLASQERIPEFVATDDWKEILPGQGIPRGLHVRLNLETGKREAKLMDPTDTHVDERLRSVVVEQDATVTVATDMGGDVDTVITTTAKPDSAAAVAVATAGDSTDDSELTVTTDDSADDEAPPAREPAWNHEKIYEVLQALPEPPALEDGMDLQSAYATLSKAEFRRQIIKLWKQRQADLKDALASMQDDAKYLGSLLDELRSAERNGSISDMVHMLEVLEYEVQDLDKTHVLHFIGGVDVLATYLNATDLPVRASASWVVGTAAKNYRDGQDWVIDAGALPKLLASLALELPVVSMNDAETVATRLRDVVEVKKKALYAIASLVRHNARGQRLFALHDGPALLATVFDGVLHPASVQLKAALLIHDLLLETDPVETTAASDSETSLQQLQRAFRSTEWCDRLASFFLEHSVKLRERQVLEVLGAMRNQLPACRETFVSAGVPSAVERVAAAFKDDSDLDSDEKRDILTFMDELLALL